MFAGFICYILPSCENLLSLKRRFHRTSDAHFIFFQAGHPDRARGRFASFIPHSNNYWYFLDFTVSLNIKQLNIWSPIKNSENSIFLLVKVTIVTRKPSSFRYRRMFKILLPLPASLREHARKLQMCLSTWSTTTSQRVHVYADIMSCPSYVRDLTDQSVILTMAQWTYFASGYTNRKFNRCWYKTGFRAELP